MRNPEVGEHENPFLSWKMGLIGTNTLGHFYGTVGVSYSITARCCNRVQIYNVKTICRNQALCECGSEIWD